MPEKSIAELEAMVGESAVTIEDFHIEAGKVEEFARAIFEDNPAFRDQEAAAEQGFDRVPAPLTYTRVSTFPRFRAVEGRGIDIGFQQEYAIHGEHEYEYERPVQVGDILTGTTTLTDVYEREGSRGGTMTFAVLETEYRDQDDELVLTERATVIETGGAIDPDGGEAHD